MKKRLLSVFLAVSLICSAFLVGCSDYRSITPQDEDLTVVGYVGDREVYLEELRFVTYTYRQLLTERYGEGIFDGEDKEYYLSLLKERVYANITADYAVLSLCEEVGIGLGESALINAVDKRMAETVDEIGGMREYKKFLKENNLTDHMLRRSVEISLLKNELMYVYIDDLSLISDSDDEIYEIIKKEFIAVRHVFVPHTDEDANEKISTAKAMLDNGNDFSSVLNEFGQDEEMTSDGIFILRGYMTKAYEEKAFELRVGAHSDIVEDELGYYVIERLKMDTARILLQIDHLKEIYQKYTFYSMLDERQLTLSFTPNDAGQAYLNDPFSK